MAPPRVPPQPHPSRLTDFAGHPLVVSLLPDQPSLVAVTAASLARATGAPAIYFAYVDTDRFTQEELPDGTVRHAPIDPDSAGDTWEETEELLRRQVAAVMEGQGVRWELRYLAGRVDRALTHLARAVDASAFVVGTHVGKHHRISDFVNGSVPVQLSHRQHRPVLVVPLEVVDWDDRAPWE